MLPTEEILMPSIDTFSCTDMTIEGETKDPVIDCIIDYVWFRIAASNGHRAADVDAQASSTI
jgi:hypothetical protein